MKDYKIYFDLGKIEYFDNNCLIQVYKFISFYDICEMVFPFHLPPDELITNVIFKEKIKSMLECYIDRLLYIFINPTIFTEKVNLQFYGSFFHMNLFVVKLETFLKIKV